MIHDFTKFLISDAEVENIRRARIAATEKDAGGNACGRVDGGYIRLDYSNGTPPQAMEYDCDAKTIALLIAAGSYTLKKAGFYTAETMLAAVARPIDDQIADWKSGPASKIGDAILKMRNAMNWASNPIGKIAGATVDAVAAGLSKAGKLAEDAVSWVLWAVVALFGLIFLVILLFSAARSR